MIRHKRVSIVIPAYNEERQIRACLQAIAEQTMRPSEVIVVDNNSTDKTVEIAQTFPFVRVIHEVKQGIVFARNAGFDAARGEVIGRIDADVVMPKNWVEHIERFYSDPISQKKSWTGQAFFYNVRLSRLVSYSYNLSAYSVNKLLIGHYTLWGSNMAITKKQWQKVRSVVCERTDIHEDLDLAIHLHQAGFEITCDKTIKTYAELRPLHTDWEYLQWWPNTLKVHGKKTWILCWIYGVGVIGFASFLHGKLSGLLNKCNAVLS